MSKKIISKPLTIALGAALVGSLTAGAASAAGAADDDPFAMDEMSSGPLIAGEGEGSCGENKGEGSCGEDTGDDSGDEKGEGSCGEGKCGGTA